MASFGEGLGGVIGGNMADNHLDNALAANNETVINANNRVGNISAGFDSSVGNYNTFGQSFLDPATAGIGEVHGAARDTMGYDQFMAGYTNTPAAQYQIQQADAVQNSSAAARGGVLSGANNRALSTINTGIVSQNANKAYEEYLGGNSQQFGQLETALGNMFKAIGVGQTATGQQGQLDAAKIGATASMASANMGATANIAGNQAKNDQSKGSGIGSMFGGLGGSMFSF